ncbi:MAG: hypothetical protein HFG48_02990 [Bacilli bacterium]|nr:hypothetical protein [Bacilli bacterium]
MGAVKSKKNTKLLQEETAEIKIKGVKKKKSNKSSSDLKVVDKISLVLLILVIIEVVMVPILIFCGITRTIPIVMFLVVPTIFVVIMYILIRSILKDTSNKVQVNHYSDNDNEEIDANEKELKRVEVTKTRMRRSSNK